MWSYSCLGTGRVALEELWLRTGGQLYLHRAQQGPLAICGPRNSSKNESTEVQTLGAKCVLWNLNLHVISYVAIYTTQMWQHI